MEISAEEIAVVTFFWWRKTVRRADITGWAMKTRSMGRGVFTGIEVYTHGRKSEPFLIFTKVLKRADLQRLIEQLPATAG